jgi:hypothetical protein
VAIGISNNTTIGVVNTFAKSIKPDLLPHAFGNAQNCIFSEHFTGRDINNRFELLEYEINCPLLRCHLGPYRGADFD